MFDTEGSAQQQLDRPGHIRAGSVVALVGSVTRGRIAIVHHEAGHAVIARILGVGV
jgi:hypothetical protein